MLLKECIWHYDFNRGACFMFWIVLPLTKSQEFFHDCWCKHVVEQGVGWALKLTVIHDHVTKWKHFPCYWPFVRGIHQWPVNSPHKGQWHRALMFPLIYTWTNSWINTREAGDLRCHCAHYDITVMWWIFTADSYVSPEVPVTNKRGFKIRNSKYFITLMLYEHHGIWNHWQLHT